MLKIYFAGSIRAGRSDAALYKAMIGWLRRFGEVLTEHVGDVALTDAGDDGPDDRTIHDRDMGRLVASDVVVAEVSTPSLGVGYELGWAASLGKPVLCLYRPTPGRFLSAPKAAPLSAMVNGSPAFRTAVYSTIEEAEAIMETFIHDFIEGAHAGLPGH